MLPNFVIVQSSCPEEVTLWLVRLGLLTQTVSPNKKTISRAWTHQLLWWEHWKRSKRKVKKLSSMAQTFLKTKNIVVNLARVDFAQIAPVYATLRIANFTNDVDAIEKMEVRKKLKSFSFSDRFGKKIVCRLWSKSGTTPKKRRNCLTKTWLLCPMSACSIRSQYTQKI